MKSAFRSLAQAPGFACVAVAMLAVGIGASTACFSLLNAFFLQSPPFERPGELVSLHMVDERTPGLMRLSYPNYVDYRARHEAFVDLAFHMYAGGRFTVDSKNTDTFGQLVSANFFELLGVRAAQGRGLLASDDAAGAPRVIVLSHAFWQSQFGGSPALVGRTITVNNDAFTVVGIAPPDFRGVTWIDTPNFWVPLAAHRLFLAGPALEFFESRRAVTVNAIGRLKPGVALAQAEASLQPVSRALATDYPADNAGRGLRIIPIAQAMHDPNVRTDMLRAGNLLIALSALILLIACANLANLLLARAAGRQREIALRVALGASRSQVVRQLLGENFLLALLGGLTGVIVAYWLRDLLWALRPRFFPESFAIAIDGRVIGFAVLATLVTGVLFGLVPALAATRVDLVSVIKRERAGGGVPLFSFRNLLVAAQVALSVVALVIAGLFIRSLYQVNVVNLGWDSRGVALISVGLAREGYDPARSMDYYRRALERLRSVPGVIDASLSTRPFLTGVNPQRTIRPQGTDESLRTRGQLMSYASVEPGFLRFLGVSFVAGRDFTPEEDNNRAPVVIVNETLARRGWPGEDPVGKTLKLFNSDTLVQVVGVVRDVRDIDLKAAPAPFAFFPLRQQFSPANAIHVRIVGNAADLMPTLRKELQALDPAVSSFNLFTYDEIIRYAMWGPRTGATLMSGFGVIALILASLGIYAVMSHAVSQRTREIGIRIAVGAQPRAVVALMLQRGVTMAAVGLVAGLGVALAVTRYIRGFLFEVDANDPLTFATIALVLGAVALLACYLPARRATKVDPLVALRSE